MRVTFVLPGPLHAFAGGCLEVAVDATAPRVSDALAALWNAHPGWRDRVLREDGRLRPHVNVFVGRDSVRYTGGLETPLPDGAIVSILPAVSGG